MQPQTKVPNRTICFKDRGWSLGPVVGGFGNEDSYWSLDMSFEAGANFFIIVGSQPATTMIEGYVIQANIKVSCNDWLLSGLLLSIVLPSDLNPAMAPMIMYGIARQMKTSTTSCNKF